MTNNETTILQDLDEEIKKLKKIKLELLKVKLQQHRETLKFVEGKKKIK